MLLMAGCNTPFGTVAVEDEYGQKIGSAWDRNLDGEADKDPVTGEVDLILPKQAYAVAQQVDEIAPMLLKGAGGLFGISLLTTLGLLWKNRKWAAFSINAVESVQVGRQAMADGGFEAALKVLDHALFDRQTGETRKAVAKIKDTELVPSVTTPEGQ